MLIRENKTGKVRRARVAPVLWSLVVDYDGEDCALEWPHATSADWGFEVVGASPEELAAMREHVILPDSPPLVMETSDGKQQPVGISFGPSVWWEPLKIADRDAIDDGEFDGRIVDASPAVVRLLRLFCMDLPGLDEVEKRLAQKPAA